MNAYVEHFVYVVQWPEWDIVKIGYATGPKRWEHFAAIKKAGRVRAVYYFPTRALALAYEATCLAVMDTVAQRAYRSSEEGRHHLGVANGWTECYWLPSRDPISFLPLPPGGSMDIGDAELEAEIESDVRLSALLALMEFNEATDGARFAPRAVAS